MKAIDIPNTLQATPELKTSFPKSHGLRAVFVIGAGLSVHMGIPIAKDILDKMLNWYRARGDDRRLSLILEFIEYFYPQYIRFKEPAPDAEDVLGLLETAEAYTLIRSAGRGFKYRRGQVSEVRDRLLRCLNEYIWSFQDDDVDRFAHLRQFVRAVGKNVVYVSFNYDLLLESALSLEGIPYRYGLFVEPGFVSIIKPHGSVNWYEKDKISAQKVHQYFVGLGDNIAVYPGFNGLSLPLGPWKPPIIVPPTPSKQVGTKDLRRMWTSFSSSVHATQFLYIIGYSLPAIDRLARLVLWRAGPKHSKKRRIYVINPCTNGEDRVFANWISPSCVPIKTYFETWVSDFEKQGIR